MKTILLFPARTAGQAMAAWCLSALFFLPFAATAAAGMSMHLEPGKVRIGSRLTVTLTNVPQSIAERLMNTNQVDLRIGNTTFGGLCREAGLPASDTVRLRFQLDFNPANRLDWSEIFQDGRRTKDFAVGLKLADGTFVAPLTNQPKLRIMALEKHRVWMGGGLMLLFAYFLLYFAFQSELIRDAVKPLPENLYPEPDSHNSPHAPSLSAMQWTLLALVLVLLCILAFFWDKGGFLFFGAASVFILIHYYFCWRKSPKKYHDFCPFSLARSQMAVWFFVVVCAWIFLWLITGTLHSLNGTVLILLGIGAGTALSVEAQDAGKPTRIEVLANRKKELEERKMEQGRLTQSEEEELKAIPKRIQKGLADYPPRATTFANDVLTDANGISFHRFQMLVWTLVMAIVFITEVIQNFAMPEFSETMLGLMGISSGTYLGFMIKEGHSSQQ